MGETSSTALLTLEDIQNQLSDEEKLLLTKLNQPPKFLQGLKSQEAKINEEFKFSVLGKFKIFSIFNLAAIASLLQLLPQQLIHRSYPGTVTNYRSNHRNAMR